MPKVSICVPAYENPEEVSRLLLSIEKQSFQDYELIITDDSKDNRIKEQIGTLLAGQETWGSKLRYYHNEKPLGHIFNWNKALSYARGEYIKIMFSDDWFTYPDSLEKLVSLLEKDQRADLAFSGSMQVSPKESYQRSPGDGYVEALAKDYRRLFLGNEIGAPSDTLYRRNKEIRFDEKSNWASDTFLYFEILKRNPHFAFTPEPLISIGIHEEQYTNSFSEKDERIYKDYEYLFQKYELSKSPSCREYFLRQYLIKQPGGLKKAKANGYQTMEFIKAFLERQRKVVLPCYAGAVLRKLKKLQRKKETKE